MKKYVDASKLRENVNVWLDGSVLVMPVSALDEAPAADVVEVKHGKWINESPYYALDGRYLKAQECSICHSVFVSDGNTPYSNHPYCCECGAKMDGGTNEETVSYST